MIEVVIQEIANGFIIDNTFHRTPLGILKAIAEKFYAPADNNGGNWEIEMDIRYRDNKKGKFTGAVLRERLK